MIISLQLLSYSSGSKFLQVAVKKVGNKVGKFTFGGFGKDRFSGNLELLDSRAIETNNGVFG
jgi:hypothetical protein